MKEQVTNANANSDSETTLGWPNETDIWPELVAQISRHYQVEADVVWIKRMDNNAARAYLMTNVCEFLGEYVFHQPYGTKQYGPDFTLPGSQKSLLASLAATVELAAGQGSELQPRLAAELTGMVKINEWLRQNPHGLALWVVPPSPTPDFAPYGFLYLAQRSGKGLRVGWFRYEAPAAIVEAVIAASRQLWQQLASEELSAGEVAAIIRRPILWTDIGSGGVMLLAVVRRWLAEAGLVLPAVNPRQEAILAKLAPLIAAYADLIWQLRQQPSENGLRRAKRLLAQIYYQAKVENETELGSQLSGLVWPRPGKNLQGSCPAVGLSPWLVEKEGELTLFQQLQGRPPVGEQSEERCPRCGHRLQNGRCPVCGWRKET